ncbi:MAG: ABC transporter ATP-binding protein [Bacilli bacterium]
MASFSFEEEALSNKLNFSSWGKIAKYALKRWGLLIIMLVLMIFITFHDGSFIPLLNRAIIRSLTAIENQAVPGRNLISELTMDVTLIFGIQFTINYLEYIGLIIAGIMIRAVGIYALFFTTNYLEMSVYIDIREDAFSQVQKLSFSYFDKTSSGWLIARLQSDTSKISDMISWGITRFVWIMFELVFILITMFLISWEMSLVLLATVPIMLFIAPYFQLKILNLSRIARNAFSKYVAWLAEVIAGAKTIKTLSIEQNVQKEANEIVTDIRDKSWKTAKTQAYFYPSVTLISTITTGIVIFVGSSLMLANTIIYDVSIFVLFIGFVSALYTPIQEFVDLFTELMSSQSSVEKILSLIETKPQINDTQEVIAKYGTLLDPKIEAYEPMQGEIEFKDVSFSYNPGTEVIHAMNLKIPKGQTIAIVGETGSGKSTTVNLLCRFYEPTTGSLCIDGEDYRKKSVGWLRHHLGYVQQTPFIFSGTIAKNIKYGKLDASDDAMIKASKAVGAHTFISALPQGYDTILKDGGSDLSVGQKQLIAFARAILRDPTIMILDEATSSIDTETEALIQKAVNQILKGRTSIVIAHRLSTIVDADRILVMASGKIIEDGNHRELMAKKGTYYQLYMNQFAELKVEQQIETFDAQIAPLK